MRVLVACEESQVVTKAFRALGHEAYSADLQECSGGHTEWHIRGDVLDILDNGWDMMIAHPECKFLCLSSARWMYDKRYPDRMQNFNDAIAFFKALQGAPIKKIAIENSQPMGRTIAKVGRYTQSVQPWMFGDGYTKGCFLWLKGLKPLIPLYSTAWNYQREHGEIVAACHNEAPSPERSKNRAKTYQGIADQMALQWAEGIEPDYRGGLFDVPNYPGVDTGRA